MTVRRIATEEDLQTAFNIRIAVFVDEQGVPLEDELDEYDQLDGHCHHILVHYDEKPVGTGRIRFVEGVGKLERICILKPFRKFGLGKVIIEGLEDIAKELGVSEVKLHGQTHAEEFYRKYGYHTASEVFIEDGIPHVLMKKNIE
ncbi:GNAT family N-acetyltransferase [Bacillus sp. AGMB 02131]|uniref:GNAT family N-acetyltransferase n=1 Tax=Peribacillus faecalis TaxID=2772559 RepID=A0A927CXS6_9BACI|nr:GNAT family N-acetyltransferase [Peribacillus faecalis]MBD3109618.1 GNAT family N-acetyltransferase [Peribacillus faecalis]